MGNQIPWQIAESDLKIVNRKTTVRESDSQPSCEKDDLSNQQLLISSRKFAVENRSLSWWHLGSTLVIMSMLVGIVLAADANVIRFLASVVLGLTLVRMFVIYHDYQHQAIFKNSRLAGGILCFFGYLMLTPPSVWRRSHDHHHRHNSKLYGAAIGSFPVMTISGFQSASWLERLKYRFARNPLVIVFGYLTVFMYGMCIRPLCLDTQRHADAITAMSVHVAVAAVCIFGADFTTTFFLLVIPLSLASAVGALLFYMQHNFPDAKIRISEKWSYTDAALNASSFLKMGRLLNWLTGNIGYHHVHHLNSKIPFYYLPTAMNELVALQSPGTISLSVRDIFTCLNLKLWDEAQQKLVGYANAFSQD